MPVDHLKIAHVYIQLKSRSLERPFDYLISGELKKMVAAGSIVLVPFGRQKALGIVAEIVATTEIDEKRLAAIEQVLDYPAVPEPLVRLSLWISEYYYCSPAAALSLVLPPGGLPPLKKKKIEGRAVYSLEAAPVRPLKVQFASLIPGAAAEMEANGFRRTKARQRVIDVLVESGKMPVAELERLAATGRSTIKSLAALGIVDIFVKEVARDNLRYYQNGKIADSGGSATGYETKSKSLRLNRSQENVLTAVTDRLNESGSKKRSRPVLIQGVTGSGKTEIYLQAIAAALENGGAAIVLVPEISLTHQAVKRFRRRFGDLVGVLHSGLSLGERYDQFMKIKSGETRVVIGPRSALFAPVADLRLIVVDEENDPSFKQENEPRYDARRAALKRAELEGAVVVYGSATPSLESYYHIKDRFILPERATGASMPQVEIVDMRDEDDYIFSRRLVEELDINLGAGGKAILLLNSRGFARFLQCAYCGHVWRCENCDISLTMHNRAGRLLCHHCGFSQDNPDICPKCGSSELRRWGAGTEKLEQEVNRLFPEAAVFRLDADTSRGYGEGPRIIQEFERSDRAILVGTQMVAKGHHFPQVTLAAVINADLALEFPEFRSEERTFSLLLQLAGRSGRSHLAGKVIIQTWNAEIDCIKMAADNRLEEFYGMELKRRQQLDYPPYTSLVNILCLSRESGKPGEAALYLKKKLEAAVRGEKILGPAELFRVKGWWRSHILVKTADVEGILKVIKPVIEHFREPYRIRGVRIVVDVDPQWLS